MAQTFRCPACGAPLELDNHSAAAVPCQHCGNTVVVPEALRAAARAAGPDPAAPRAAELEAVARLARTGQLIEAVKRYRQATGVSLEQARRAVEQLAAGAADLRPGLAGPEAAAGQKIEAVRLVRQSTGLGLQAAVDAVEAIEAGLPRPPAPPARRAGGAGGCLATAAVVLAIGLCAITAGAAPLMLSGSFRQAAALAVSDPALQAVIGAPVEVVWWRLAWGRIRCASRCSANYSFTVAGPDGEARVQVLSDSSAGLPYIGEGEWSPKLRYDFGGRAPALPYAASAAPLPATPTLSAPQADATAGAQARAAQAVEAAATAQAQAQHDAAATAMAQANTGAEQNAARLQASADALAAAQAGWTTTVISETFDDNANGWPVETVNDGSLAVDPAVAGGLYHWWVRPASGGHYLNMLPGFVPPTTDFSAAVDVRLASGAQNGTYIYGLVYRAEGWDYGLFGLSNDGRVHVAGVVSAATLWAEDFSHPAVRAEPGAVNRLMVRAVGPDFAFLVNGQPVFAWSQPQLNDGRLGLSVYVLREGADAEIEFDNFEVRAP